MSNVLAVIPARGGSKRLPGKNIKHLAGHPMIAYTIEAVKRSKLVSDWLVSTESENIRSVAIKYGAPAPFLRPLELATDKVRNIDVVLHALEFMENSRGKKYDMIVLLQPTAPVRRESHIDEAIRLLEESCCDSLAAVKGPIQKRDPVLKKKNSDGNLVAYCDKGGFFDREPCYIYNAALYAVKRDYFVENNKLISDEQVPLLRDKYCSTDVDEFSDFIVAEAYMKNIDGLIKFDD